MLQMLRKVQERSIGTPVTSNKLQNEVHTNLGNFFHTFQLIEPVPHVVKIID